jgi:alanine dehydrogenase
MIIGIPKEIKNNEFRVSATAPGVHAYVAAGHTVLVEKNAGAGSGISDADYIAAGAQIIDLADDAGLAKGLNVHEGKILYQAVAQAHNL